MMEAPSPVDDAQLKMLHLDIIPTENKGSA